MQPTAFPDVTLVVPTHNRPERVSRVLDYYSAYAPELRILVVDSSDAPLPAATQHPRGGITYLHHPGEGYVAKMRAALDRVDTLLLVLCADDYLILPSAIQHCCRFLQEHEDFSAVEGLSLALTRFLGRNLYTNYALEGLTFRLSAGSSLGRLAELLDPGRYYAFFYSCQRTHATRHAFSLLDTHDLQNPYLVEYAYISLLAIAGKAAVLPIVYSLITGFLFSGPRPYANIHMVATERGAEFMRAMDALSVDLSRADALPVQVCHREILELFDRFAVSTGTRAAVDARSRGGDLLRRAYEKPFYAAGRPDLLKRLSLLSQGCRDVILGPGRAKRILRERVGLSLDDPQVRSLLDHLATNLIRPSRRAAVAG